MKMKSIAAISISSFIVSTSLSFAQDSAPAGSPGTVPLTSGTGSGRDSKVTGYSESGRGGTGGTGGGPSSNGTAAGAGTATGGNPSGYPDRN